MRAVARTKMKAPQARPTTELLRWLATVCVVGVLAVFVLSAIGLSRIHSRYVISLAQEDAVRVSRGIVASQADTLLSVGPERHLVLDLTPAGVASLDTALAGFSSSFEIVKVKLYSPEARIVYSTDPAIVGVVDQGNERLASALGGRVSSTIESKDAVVDLQEETRFSVDVVETYVPIYNVQAEVVGAFEVYQDVTQYQAGARARYYYSLAVVGASLAAVTLLGYGILRRKVRGGAAAASAAPALAKTDPLTGLHDREAAYDRAAQECNRMKRRSERNLEASLALVLVEIDGAADIERRHGSGSLDAVVAEVARRLVDSVRSYDVVGRAGSAGFIVILPETSLPEASQLAERLRVGVERAPVRVSEKDIPVTISLGAAITFGPTPDVDVVLSRAGAALAEARDGGGNRAAYLTSDGESPTVVA